MHANINVVRTTAGYLGVVLCNEGIRKTLAGSYLNATQYHGKCGIDRVQSIKDYYTV
jgi:hypothetical protein